MSPEQTPIEGCPVLLIGLGKIGFSILQILHEAGVPVVVVTRDVPPDWLRRAEKLATRLLHGDGRSDDILLDAGICSARAVIVATNDDLANLEIVFDAHRLAPEVPIVVRMLDLDLAERVAHDLPVRAALNPAEIAAPAFVAAALENHSLRTFDVEGAALHISGIAQFSDEMKPARTVGEMVGGFSVLAIEHPDGECETFPNPNEPIEPGDAVIYVHDEPLEVDLSDEKREWIEVNRKESIHRLTSQLLMASLHPATGRPVLQWLVCVIVGIVVVSTAVFHFALNLTWVDAFYFTTTIITTVGFGDIHLLDAPTWVKLYGCLLMLSGVSGLLFLYGLVVDYLVRLRVEQALGTRRAELRGHVIVAGVGDLGAHVATRLYRLGVPVLAIEREEVLSTSQELPESIPRIRGDAASRAILERASVESARTVLAMTDDDITNLRIARLAQSLNERVRTVVRLFQSRLAEKMGTSLLGADHPLNPSEAAAATFAAHALAPDVLHGFALGGHLLMLKKADARCLGVIKETTAGEVCHSRRCIVRMRKGRGDEQFRALGEKDSISPDDTLVILEEFSATETSPPPPQSDGIPPSAGRSSRGRGTERRP